MQRRQLIGLLGIPALALGAPAEANAANDRRDGNWWRTLDRKAKLNFALGMVDGLILAIEFIYDAAVLKNAKYEKATEFVGDYADACDEYVAGIRDTQAVDGLDAFYQDFRNRTILVPFGMRVVAFQIRGVENSSIQDAVRYYRQRARGES